MLVLKLHSRSNAEAEPRSSWQSFTIKLSISTISRLKTVSGNILLLNEKHFFQYTGWPKKLLHFSVRIFFVFFSNIDQFSNLFHCLNQTKICNNIITKNPTTPQVCRYTTLWNINVFKSTIENKTTSVTTHFKSALSISKADTYNSWCKNCRMRQLL